MKKGFQLTHERELPAGPVTRFIQKWDYEDRFASCNWCHSVFEIGVPVWVVGGLWMCFCCAPKGLSAQFAGCFCDDPRPYSLLNKYEGWRSLDSVLLRHGAEPIDIARAVRDSVLEVVLVSGADVRLLPLFKAHRPQKVEEDMQKIIARAVLEGLTK